MVNVTYVDYGAMTQGLPQAGANIGGMGMNLLPFILGLAFGFAIIGFVVGIIAWLKASTTKNRK